ncbi:hypothetical protein C0995_003478 [Termitomyces sp. Mi166|nr:hypothetical protein C0995_003478 [Termitomyces sp. Mi166\
MSVHPNISAEEYAQHLEYVPSLLCSASRLECPPPLDPKVAFLIGQLELVLRSKERYSQLMMLEGSAAQKLLDILQWLLDCHRLDLGVKRELIVMMQRLSARSGLYPACYELRDVAISEEQPRQAGIFADIYKGNYRGYFVAVKILRIYRHSIVDILKMITKEALLWGQLSHPNVLPFYGMSRLQGRLGMISPWMQNEEVTTYLRRDPNAPRLLLADILVDHAGRAVVGHFGISSISDSQIIAWRLESEGASKGSTVRWQAPELLDFESKIPFAEIRMDVRTAFHVLNGARPSRPASSTPPWSAWGLTEELWALMERCWMANPHERPPAAEIAQYLAEISPPDLRLNTGIAIPSIDFRREINNPLVDDTLDDILEIIGTQLVSGPTSVDLEVGSLISRLGTAFTRQEQYKRLLACRGSDAERLLDTFQWAWPGLNLNPNFRKNLIVATQRLSSASQLYPACYKLENVVDKVGDIFKKFSKEVILWGQLSHPNILAIYGINEVSKPFSIISPWIEHGNIRKYLMHNPRADRRHLATDVANGLAYLHRENIVHGDLKSLNIFVDGTGRALLADFGISSILGNDIVTGTLMSTIASRGGTLMYHAPELIDIEKDQLVANSPASDVYAYGCVKYGACPKRPEPSSIVWKEWGLTEELWSLMEDCWKEDPSRRPTAANILGFWTSQLSEDLRPVQSTNTLSSLQFRRQMVEPMGKDTLEAINRYILLVLEDAATEDTRSNAHEVTESEPPSLVGLNTLHTDFSGKQESERAL